MSLAPRPVFASLLFAFLMFTAGCVTAPAQLDAPGEPTPGAEASRAPSPSPAPATTPSPPAPSPSGAGQTAPTSPTTPPSSHTQGAGTRPGDRSQCTGSGPVALTHLPMRLEDFGVLLPYGLMVDGHVTPIDHMYLSPADRNSPRDAYEVRAVADGWIVNLQPRDAWVGDKTPDSAKIREFRLDFEHTCTFRTYSDLVTSLAPEIESAWNNATSARYPQPLHIPVKAGQLVGRIGGQTLDFGVYNYSLTLPGFVVPEHYDWEPWKVHTDDPFLYFVEPLRSQLLAKNVRVAEPRAGKIDYDIDGRLVGNWFKQGTNGYAGVNRQRYWDGHLSLVYDYIDPTQVRFSTGDFGGVSKQFGIRGNAPDPANVSVATGIVKYELTFYEYYDRDTGASWRPQSVIASPGARNFEAVQGVALVQLLEDRVLKVQVFPGKRAADVLGFDEGAILYER